MVVAGATVVRVTEEIDAATATAREPRAAQTGWTGSVAAAAADARSATHASVSARPATTETAAGIPSVRTGDPAAAPFITTDGARRPTALFDAGVAAGAGETATAAETTYSGEPAASESTARAPAAGHASTGATAGGTRATTETEFTPGPVSACPRLSTGVGITARIYDRATTRAGYQRPRPQPSRPARHAGTLATSPRAGE
jgi:hypothetical protein